MIGTPSEIFHENLSSLFKRDNLNSQIFNILTPPQEEVDSKNTFFEDGGVQDIYEILYFHYIELTLFIYLLISQEKTMDYATIDIVH